MRIFDKKIVQVVRIPYKAMVGWSGNFCRPLIRQVTNLKQHSSDERLFIPDIESLILLIIGFLLFVPRSLFEDV